MAQDRAIATRGKLMQTATDLIRRHGYGPTSIDQICAQARVTKGAFFHHFKSKEQLAESCLHQWDRQTALMERSAPFQQVPDPRVRVLGYMDFFAGMLADPKMLKSCLAGTTAQEVSSSNEALREAAHAYFENARKRFEALLQDACRGSRAKVDTAGLAALWIAAIQGSLILAKASQDESVIATSLDHAKRYIAAQLPAKAKGRTRKQTRQ
ncbi:MAG: TetR/AcrR family transcriptional regulator [Acidimicrobiia bacterium]|nr:TetR/AcrR family transcriptional regulator [Acidimicrobiia bacterium]